MGVVVHEVVGTVQRAPAPGGAPAGAPATHEDEATLQLVRQLVARQHQLDRRVLAD
ncbi:MAG: hypothetical protein ACJ8DC_17640 [Gemmatimonadales bacterium]